MDINNFIVIINFLNYIYSFSFKLKKETKINNENILFSMETINEKLKQLKNEDLIWIIYIFISISAIFSNKYEKESLIFKSKESYKKYKTINVCIFTIALFIYLYFLELTIKNSEDNHTEDDLARIFAALLFLIGGVIYLILEIKSTGEEETAII